MRSSEHLYSSSNSHQYSERSLSRRNFLKGASAVATAAFVGMGASDRNPAHSDSGEYRYDTQKTDILFLKLDEESQRKISHIRHYREQIGLAPYPDTIIQCVLQDNHEWQFESDPFSNELPETLYSYGMVNEHMQSVAFGNNAGRLVRRITVNSQAPSLYSFMGNASDRVCTIGYNTSAIDLNGYMETALHEAIGHGSDPSDNPLLYPTNVLLDVELGRSQMLSQAFSVEGQFLNHPNDLMYPQLKRNIGEIIASQYYKGDLSPAFLKKEDGEIAQTVIDEEKDSHFSELRFNKKVCERLGDSFIKLNANGELLFSPELAQFYSTRLESSLKEIYAEMVRLSMSHPEELQHNTTLLEGCRAVLSAIQGKEVVLDEIRQSIFALPPEVVERQEVERSIQAALTPRSPLVSSPFYEDSPNKPLILRAQKEQVLFQQQKNDFLLFVDEGILPESSLMPFFRKHCEDYAKARSIIEKEYPFLKHITTAQYDMQFDPNLDIWDIRKIETAMDNTYTRKLLADLIHSPQTIDIDEVRKRTKVLSQFISSPAFGS